MQYKILCVIDTQPEALKMAQHLLEFLQQQELGFDNRESVAC